MKDYLGGLLSLALGSVLIFTGISASASGAVGGVAPPLTCGAAVVVGAAAPCPSGQITINSTTTTAGTSAPATWPVQITSTCLDSSGGQPVNRTVNVPANGSLVVPNLYIFGDSAGTTPCAYAYSLTPGSNQGFTTTFDPASSVMLMIDNETGVNNTDVNLLNVGMAVPTITVTEAPTTTTVTGATTTVTASPTSAAAPVTSTYAPTTYPSVTPPISVNGGGGPTSTLNQPAVIAGALLLLLGAVLLTTTALRRRRIAN